MITHESMADKPPLLDRLNPASIEGGTQAPRELAEQILKTASVVAQLHPAEASSFPDNTGIMKSAPLRTKNGDVVRLTYDELGRLYAKTNIAGLPVAVVNVESADREAAYSIVVGFDEKGGRGAFYTDLNGRRGEPPTERFFRGHTKDNRQKVYGTASIVSLPEELANGILDTIGDSNELTPAATPKKVGFFTLLVFNVVGRR